MTHATTTTVRELIALSRLGSIHLEEDVTNLDTLLAMSDENLQSILTIEDLQDIETLIPAYFKAV